MVQVRQPMLRAQQEKASSKVVVLCVAVNVLVLLVLALRRPECSCSCNESSSSGSKSKDGRSGGHQPAALAAAAAAQGQHKQQPHANQHVVQQKQQQPHQNGVQKHQDKIQAAVGRISSAGPKASERCAPLSKQLLQRHAQDGIVMLAVTDWRMFNAFGQMWLEGVQQAGIRNYVIAATDQQTVDYLDAHGIGPCIVELAPEHEAAMMQQGYAWGSAAYNAATWHKPVISMKVLKLGFHVMHSDLDVRWLANPLPWLAHHAKSADLLMSSDLLVSSNAMGDDGLDPVAATWVPANTGVWYAKATPGGIAGIQSWLDQKAKDPNRHDNTGFLAWFSSFKQLEARLPHSTRLLQLNSTALGLVPVSVFLNGYTYSFTKMHQLKAVTPLCVHMTWISQDIEGKLARLRENKWYPDPPEYFKGPKLLTMDLYTPPTPANFNNWTDSEAMITVHLRALQRQLAQLYPAMALAVLLGRTLVLPQLTCFCWNNWYATDRCRIPGDTLTQLPWDCSLEQIFKPKALSEPRLAIGNASFSFREASFFSNPRLPASVLAARTTVDVSNTHYSDTCGQDRTACVHESHKASSAVGGLDERRLLVPRGVRDRDVVALLQPYADARVLHVSDPVALWGGFADAAHKTQYEAWLDSVTTEWCCRYPEVVKKSGLLEREKLHIRPRAQHMRPAAQSQQAIV